MTIDNDNYKTILPSRYKLSGDDCLNFRINNLVLTYVPSMGFLSNIRGDNDEIFYRLNLDKIEFCRKYYSSAPGHGIFPETKGFNWEKDLLKCTYALFEECDKQSLPVKKINLDDITFSELKTMPVKASIRVINRDVKREAQIEEIEEIVDNIELPF